MENRVTDQAAYLIHRKDYRNNSLILELFTRDFGRVSLLARGAKNSKTPAKFQPFQLLTVGWVGATELKTLTTLDAGQSLIPHPLYISALYVNELLLIFLPQGDGCENLFDSYQLFFKGLSLQNMPSQLRLFEVKLMRFAGLMPDISSDAKSGQAIIAEQYYLFYPNIGFVQSAQDTHSFHGQTILEWLSQDVENEAVVKLSRVIMRSIIDYNLNGKKLKSRDIYQQMQNAK